MTLRLLQLRRQATPRPILPIADHRLEITPDQIKEDVLLYRDRVGVSRLVILDHSRIVA